MSDLLKQAIADAKAVRATALANARAALEEAFAPKLQSMLATKLQQEVEAEEGEELPEEPIVPAAEAPAEAPVDAAAAPEGDVAVDLPGEEVEAPAPEGDVPAPDAAVEPVEAPVPAEEELPVDEFAMEEGGTSASTTITASQDAENLAEEKASPDYKKVTKGHKTEDPQGPSKEFAKGPGKADKQETKGEPHGKEGSHKASPDYKKTTTGHKTPDPQGPSKELAKGPGKADKNETGKVLEEDEISEGTLDEILKELESEVALENCGAEAVGAEAPAGEAPQPQEEEIDLSALLESDEKDEKKEDEKDEDDDKPDFLKENLQLKKELSEYRNAVQYLRDRINEVNLLNAKLLYTNKLFKQANLTNEQKLKVIEQFDLTKSVREAKLTYANLSESLSFGAKTPTVVKEAAKAPVKKAAVVKTIAEGLASKPVASTKPTKTEVLSEGADMANRFKKLAGIRK